MACIVMLASCAKVTKIDYAPHTAGHSPTLAKASMANSLAATSLGSLQVFSLAGSDNATYADGTGAAASFVSPNGIAVDAAGTLYVADRDNHRIRKITSGGVVTTLAGSGSPGSANATGAAASFSFPTGVAVDGAGTVYVADSGNHQIRRITANGVVTTLAGSRQGVTDPGPASAALFNGPNGVAVDGAGNVYVSDAGNFLVRKITTAGFVDLVAGSGPGFSDQRGDLAAFQLIAGIAVDAAGNNIYVSDAGNHRIRQITRQGDVSTLAGQDNPGNTDGGPGIASFGYPAGIAVDASGIVYVGDKANHRIRQVISGGVVIPLAGSGIPAFMDGGAAIAAFKFPTGVAVDAAGNVYVADLGTHRIREIGITTVVSTFAGDGQGGYLEGTGTGARFHAPDGIAVDAAGNVYVAEKFNHRIRKITPAGVTSSLAGNGSPGFVNGQGSAAQFAWPAGIAVDAAGNVYVADNTSIRKVTPAGQVTTLAGTATLGFKDGPAGTAQFNEPSGVAVDAAGNVYVADQENNRIRKISAGMVTTLAGTGISGLRDGPGSTAMFGFPRDVAVDASGNVLVADDNNNCIRKITPAGDVSTLAGSSSLGHVDGPAALARFNSPFGLTVDASGNIYIEDGFNGYWIRKITPTGQVSTVASNGSFGATNGIGPVATFRVPAGIAADASGRLYVADRDNNLIRRIQ